MNDKNTSETSNKTQKSEKVGFSDQKSRNNQIYQAIHNGPVVIFQWSNEIGWPVEYVSSNVEEVLGYSQNDFCSGEINYEEIVHEDDLNRVKQEVKNNSDETTNSFQHEPYRIVTSNGDVRWVLDFTQIIRGKNGEVAQYIGYIVDKTKQKQQELHLRQAESVGDFGTWEWNIETGNIHWSEGLYQILRIDREKTPPKFEEILEKTNPDHQQKVQEAWQKSLEEGIGSVQYQIQIENKKLWIQSQWKIQYTENRVPQVAFGIIKDVTKQVERQLQLRSLSRHTTQIIEKNRVDSETIAKEIITGLDKILNLSIVEVHLRDEQGKLLPVEYSKKSTIGIIEPESGILWDGYLSTGTTVVGTVEKELLSDYNMAVAPIGSHGAIIVGIDKKSEYSQHTKTIIEVLGSTAAAILEREERTEDLEKEKSELARRIDKIEQYRQMSNTLRSLQSKLKGVNSREKLLAEACSVLKEFSGFDGIWVGELVFDTNQITPVANVGIPNSYFESISLSPENDRAAPAARAVNKMEPFQTDTLTRKIRKEQWRGVALSHEFKSVLAVPIENNGIIDAVAVIYSEKEKTFNKTIEEFIIDSLDLIAYMLKSIRRKKALYANAEKKFVFEITPVDRDPIRRLAQESSSKIKTQTISIEKGGSYVSYCEFETKNTDSIEKIGRSINGIKIGKEIVEADKPIYEITVFQGSLFDKITDIDAFIESLQVDAEKYKLTVTVESSRDRQQFINRIKREFPTVELKQEKQSYSPDEVPWTSLLTNSLSENQLNVLKTSYYGGYFDKKERRTGSELADTLGISQPTFSNHLRDAQRSLFSEIWRERQNK